MAARTKKQPTTRCGEDGGVPRPELEGKPTVAEVEQILKGGAQQIDDNHIRITVDTKPTHGRDSDNIL